jgi:ubiquinone/menaquinone biosynthesis C-methylase UbiE
MPHHVPSPRTLTLIAFALVIAVVVAAAQRSGSTIATERIFEALDVREGVTVCEIGAGDGEQTLDAARLVGPTGRVYTTELGDDRVKSLRGRVERSGLGQITVLAGDAVKTNFPDGACDALFMRNVYHHFEDPARMNESIVASIKPGGRVAIIDFTPRSGRQAERPSDRDEDSTHGVSPEAVAREMRAAGLEVVSSEEGAERWFMVVVSRPKS